MKISPEYEYEYYSVFKKHRIIRFSNIFGSNYSNIFEYQIIRSPLFYADLSASMLIHQLICWFISFYAESWLHLCLGETMREVQQKQRLKKKASSEESNVWKKSSELQILAFRFLFCFWKFFIHFFTFWGGYQCDLSFTLRVTGAKYKIQNTKHWWCKIHADKIYFVGYFSIFIWKKRFCSFLCCLVLFLGTMVCLCSLLFVCSFWYCLNWQNLALWNRFWDIYFDAIAIAGGEEKKNKENLLKKLSGWHIETLHIISNSLRTDRRSSHDDA